MREFGDEVEWFLVRFMRLFKRKLVAEAANIFQWKGDEGQLEKIEFVEESTFNKCSLLKCWTKLNSCVLYLSSLHLLTRSHPDHSAISIFIEFKKEQEWERGKENIGVN